MSTPRINAHCECVVVSGSTSSVPFALHAPCITEPWCVGTRVKALVELTQTGAMNSTHWNHVLSTTLRQFAPFASSRPRPRTCSSVCCERFYPAYVMFDCCARGNQSGCVRACDSYAQWGCIDYTNAAAQVHAVGVYPERKRRARRRRLTHED